MEIASKLRIAIAGLGNMGLQHIQTVSALPRATLAGICDVDQGRLERAGAATPAPRYRDYATMLEREKPDAVLIATPHYDHTGMAIEAFRRGMHVLVEKPVGVHGLDVRRTIAAHEDARRKLPGLVFAAMFNQRTHGHYRKIRPSSTRASSAAWCASRGSSPTGSAANGTTTPGAGGPPGRARAAACC